MEELANLEEERDPGVCAGKRKRQTQLGCGDGGGVL